MLVLCYLVLASLASPPQISARLLARSHRVAIYVGTYFFLIKGPHIFCLEMIGTQETNKRMNVPTNELVTNENEPTNPEVKQRKTRLKGL